MKAVLCTKYGPPNVLKVKEIEREKILLNLPKIWIFLKVLLIKDIKREMW